MPDPELDKLPLLDPLSDRESDRERLAVPPEREAEKLRDLEEDRDKLKLGEPVLLNVPVCVGAGVTVIDLVALPLALNDRLWLPVRLDKERVLELDKLRVPDLEAVILDRERVFDSEIERLNVPLVPLRDTLTDLEVKVLDGVRALAVSVPDAVREAEGDLVIMVAVCGDRVQLRVGAVALNVPVAWDWETERDTVVPLRVGERPLGVMELERDTDGDAVPTVSVKLVEGLALGVPTVLVIVRLGVLADGDWEADAETEGVFRERESDLVGTVMLSEEDLVGDTDGEPEAENDGLGRVPLPDREGVFDCDRDADGEKLKEAVRFVAELVADAVFAL